MSAPYFLRLLCISLASFFLIHLALGLLVRMLSPVLIRRVERMLPRRAAGFLLAVRLLPSACAFTAVAGLCVPSYLRFEQRTGGEEVGLACIAAALLCAACFAISAVRSWRAAARSLGYVRYCQMVGRRTCLAGDALPAWVVDGPAPFLVLAGIVHPRLMVSKDVVVALAADQLAAALRHEHAHRVSRDNLKRLVVLLAPDLLPFWRSFDALERAWSRFAEWAADDHAVAGDSTRSLSLASALVRVARMGACPQAPPLVTSLLADNEDLAERVNRLLRETPPPSAAGPSPVLLPVACGLAGAALAVLMLQPAVLYPIHGLLEHLTH